MSTLTEHDRLVLGAVAALQQNGFTNIQDDCSRSPNTCPDILYWQGNPEGHRPDIVAYRNGLLHICEIEEAHTLGSEHTASQIRLFAAHAEQSRGLFYLIVPPGAEDAAKATMSRLNVPPHVWTQN